jgi:hypothetical protein
MHSAEPDPFFVDPELIGQWKNKRTVLEFFANGQHYSGTVSNRYEIVNDGQLMIIGGRSEYHRFIPGGVGLVGYWTDKEENEIIEYRADGFYHLTFQNEKVAYFGKWSADDSHFDSFEFKANINTENNKIYMRSYLFDPSVFPYEITGNLLTLFSPDGAVQVYEKCLI